MADETLFERIISGEIPSHVVAKGDGWYAFLDINPRRPGHTLVVPYKGVSHLAKLSGSEAGCLIQGAQLFSIPAGKPFFLSRILKLVS